MTDERVRLMRQGVVNYVGIAISGLLSLLLVPILLRGLGSELYGLWLAALVPPMFAGELMQGLANAVTREVAVRRGPTDGLLVGAVNAYLVLVVASALAAFAVSMVLLPFLHLSPATESEAPALFAVIDSALIGEQLIALSVALYSGGRHFAIANVVRVSSAVVRATGTAALVVSGAGVVALGGWYSATAAIIGVAALAVVSRADPRLQWGRWRATFGPVRRATVFAASSSVVTVMSVFLWEVPRLLIVVLRGPADLVAYHVGSLPPIAVAFLGWRAAQVIFPVASGADDGHARELLRLGTRWTTALTLAPCAILFVLADPLLRVWLGDPPPDSAWVLRVMALAVALDGMGSAALQITWATAALRPILGALAAAAAMSIGLGALLVATIGPSGAAVGMLAGSGIAAGLYLWQVCRRLAVSAASLLRQTIGGVVPAVAVGTACAAAAAGFADRGWPELIGAASGAGLAAVLALYASTARLEERRFIDGIPLLGPIAGAFKRTRDLAFAPIRRLLPSSVWAGLLPGTTERMDRIHLARSWNYDEAGELARYARVLEIVRERRGPAPWGPTLEIGCAEGAFTARLAGLCSTLVAHDISAVAVGRARKALHALPAVRVEQGDMIHDDIEGTFELIFAMDVLSYVPTLPRLRSVRDKLVRTLVPGGLLVVTEVRPPAGFRPRWWTAPFVCTVDEILRSLECPDLRAVLVEAHERPGSSRYLPHVIALFERSQ